MTLQAHEYANAFPLLRGAELQELADDIAANGLREPILLYNGAILDGRNRAAACDKAGVAPAYEEFAGDDAAARALVISRNIMRRHLTSAQRVASVAILATNWREDGDNADIEIAQGARKAASEQVGIRRDDRGVTRVIGVMRQGVGDYAPIVNDAIALMRDGVGEVGPHDAIRAIKGAKQAGEDAGKARGKLESAQEAVAEAQALAEDARGEEDDADALANLQAARAVAEQAGAAVAEAEAKEQDALDLAAAGIAEVKAGNADTIARGMTNVLAQRTRDNPPPLPQGEYAVIYADPPWRVSDSQSESSRAIENHYPTMELADIKATQVPAADNAVLYLWAISPMLPEALAVMRAWGFTYKSSLAWDKQIIGMGAWFRNQHEFLLVGVKGKEPPPPPPAELRKPSVLSVKRGEHSAKPDCVRDWIDEWYGAYARIELYARKAAPGWAIWGNEV